MIVIQMLPNELEIPLGERAKQYEGAVAVVRPFGIEEWAKITDAFGKDGVQLAALACVRQQLIRIDGLGMQNQYGKVEPFDKQNPAHWGTLPFSLIDHIFAKMYDFTGNGTARITVREDPPEASP
jgi:hypothetical protein